MPVTLELVTVIAEGNKTEIMNASLLSSVVCAVPREICQELFMQTLFFWDLKLGGKKKSAWYPVQQKPDYKF